ncbi:MAG: YjjG family noncanonical pyrimidine nucleotidase [Oscillospiraceae bacterium]|nr:YjjG family noncanonical pyrimidine nucleotidase [Oscillospiraceae bacterium]
MRYRVILADVDNTLFDFNAASSQGLAATFAHFGLPFTDDDRGLFFAINAEMWRAYERGEMEKRDIYEGRFRKYLAQKGQTADVPAMNKYYMLRLREGHQLMPHCRELLEALNERGCEVYAATNGETAIQKTRMAASGVAHLFRGHFISEGMCAAKPNKAFFDEIFQTIGEEKRACAIMLGDSVTGDMQGGRNAGVATCFYGDPAEADDRCDYAIRDLLEFLDVIE